MMDAAVSSYLLAGLPILGTLSSLVLWEHPRRLRTCSIVFALASLIAAAGLSSLLSVSPVALLFIHLLPLAACASLLGQPIHRSQRLSWVMTLLLLGLGLGILTNRNFIGSLLLLIVFVLTAFLLYRHHSALWPVSWSGIGTLVLGGVFVVVGMFATPPISTAMTLATCAVLLPLLPFHEGYIAVLTRLPGSVPPFAVVLFPALGLHGLIDTIADAPPIAHSAVTFLSLGGGLLCSAKALVQSRVRPLVGYGSLSFFSVTWWFVASTSHVTLQSGVFVGSVGLATSGLLLAWQVVWTRYGDGVDPQAISGLASTMPNYAVLLSLVTIAAMGFPPFGVFAGFMGMLLTSAYSSVAGLFAIFLIWLAASWYVLDCVQRLLFGRRRFDLRFEDLRKTETGALLIVLLGVAIMGIAPVTQLGSGSISYLPGF